MTEKIDVGIGACGVACEVCPLLIDGLCDGCQPPESEGPLPEKEAKKHPCPIFRCANEKGFYFCGRDCEEFPCRNFREGEVQPYSKGHLDYIEEKLGEEES